MAIQWYPGHMTQARKKAEETMEYTDMVIEVLDARIPEASHNPVINDMRLFRQRPNLKILNKADLADPKATQAWLNYFNALPNTKAVALSCKKPGDAKKIPAICRTIAPHRGTHLKPLRMMIMGIPNVGKSTLMNALLNRRVAKVGDEPAVTKNQQRFDISDTMSITDTPGMMWPKIDYDSDGFMLAACHAIGRNAVEDEDIALFLAGNLLENYPELVDARYKLTEKKFDVASMDNYDLMDAIAKRRFYKRKDGEWDMERTSTAFLTDFRSGAIGRMNLETPTSRQALIDSFKAAEKEKTESVKPNDTENISDVGASTNETPED
jgi:ribosome biogenesis GTPase A